MSDPTPATGAPRPAPKPQDDDADFNPLTTSPMTNPDNGDAAPEPQPGTGATHRPSTGEATRPTVASDATRATMPADLHDQQKTVGLPLQASQTTATNRPTVAGTAGIPATVVDPSSKRISNAATLPTHAEAATRPTIGDNQDQMATLPARGFQSAPVGEGTTSDRPTRLDTNPFAEADSRQASKSADDKRGQTGSMMRTSFTQRVSRTKLNLSLPPDAQELDAKLQLSRPSVLADLATSINGESVPGGIKKLIEEQGTEGRYAINRELAHGGMGAVLDISDHDFRRKAAMKVILSRFARTPEAVERFLAEAQVTAQLEHPNIVPIHDLGVMADGTLYFTMKLIEGQSLGKVVKLLQQQRGTLKRDGALVAPNAESQLASEHWNEQEKLHVFLKVLDGVGFAHSRGVIHRDIKPDNIMLGSHGEVLVVDWGIAKILGAPEVPNRGGSPGMSIDGTPASGVVSIRSDESASATMAGAAMGTVYYMPPEQAQGDLEAMDARSDIYALGSTLYELLALKRCLTSTSLNEMIAAIVEGRWIGLDVADPSINPDLVAIVHRSMALAPANRYQSCDDFANDLRRYLAGRAVEARKRSTLESIAQWVAQHRVRILSVAAAAVIAIAAAIGTFWQIRAHRHQEAVALFAEASSHFEHLPKNPSVADVQPIELDLAKVFALAPGDPVASKLKADVDVTMGIAMRVEQQLAEQRIAHETAQRLIVQAKQSAAQGDLPGLTSAVQQYKQALTLTPDDDALQQALLEVSQRANNRARVDREQALMLHATTARRILIEASTLAPLDAHMEEKLKQVDAELTLADTDPDIKISGLPELVKQVGALRETVKNAVKDADYLERGKALAGKVRALVAANDLDKGIEQARAALAFAPTDSFVQTVYGEAAAAKATADAKQAEAKRRADAEKAASGFVATAATALADMERRDAQREQANQEYLRLHRTLADRSQDDQKPMFLALQAASTAHQAQLQAWSTSEDEAQKAIALLEPWSAATPVPEAYRQAQGLLATLYHLRLREARRSNNREEATLYASQLARADRFDHTYAKDLATVAMVTIQGQPSGALVIARPLVQLEDTRLGPGGESHQMPFGQAIELTAGTWQFSAGDTVISWVITPDHPTTITWPHALPQIPGVPLRYVPGDLHQVGDGLPRLRPYLLGVTEVTYRQYLAFLHDPEIFAQIRKSYHHNQNKDDASEGSRQPLLYMPTQANGAPVYHVPMTRDQKDIADIQISDGLDPDLPVSLLTCDDAIAYCTWVSHKYGVTARLPLHREWAFAANGDDPQRIYPWGSYFNGNFCVSSATVKREQPARVQSNPADIGPFGHCDLAGNVREWLGDVATADDPRAAGAHRGLIAGGGWADDAEIWFHSDYAESVEPHDVRNEVIGFRILVEVP